MTEVKITFTYRPDEDDPSLEEIRAVAEATGCDLDRFLNQALLHWYEKRRAVVEEHKKKTPAERKDAFGVEKKLDDWARSGAPGVVKPPPRRGR